MAFLLDTDTVSFLVKKNHTYHETVKAHVLRYSPEEVSISVFTECELMAGFHRISNEQTPYKQRVKTALDLLLTSLRVKIPSVLITEYYGKIRAGLTQVGQDIGAMDCLIAAHAMSEELTLVTHNTVHFNRINQLGLGVIELLDWTK